MRRGKLKSRRIAAPKESLLKRHIHIMTIVSTAIAAAALMVTCQSKKAAEKQLALAEKREAFARQTIPIWTPKDGFVSTNSEVSIKRISICRDVEFLKRSYQNWGKHIYLEDVSRHTDDPRRIIGIKYEAEKPDLGSLLEEAAQDSDLIYESTYTFPVVMILDSIYKGESRLSLHGYVVTYKSNQSMKLRPSFYSEDVGVFPIAVQHSESLESIEGAVLFLKETGATATQGFRKVTKPPLSKG